MRVFPVFILSTCIGTGLAVASDQKADIRAVDSCKANGATFVAVADCLPPAHVAFKGLDAFEAIYPAEAQPLKAKCIHLNQDSIAGAFTCITTAVDAALSLKRSLPDGTSLGDPIFDAVSDAALFEKLRAAEKEARLTFPDHGLWGGNLYHPYK